MRDILLLLTFLIAATVADAQTLVTQRPAVQRPPFEYVKSIDSPDPRIDRIITLANAERSTKPNCAPLQPDEIRSTATRARWLLQCMEYWNASADYPFLQARWPTISREFNAVADRDYNDDGLMDHPFTGIHVAAMWIAALDGIHPMAVVVKDTAVAMRAARMARNAQQSFESIFWIEEAGLYATTPLRAPVPTRWPAAAIALGVTDSDRSDRMMQQLSLRTIDPLDVSPGAMTIASTAMANYRLHRGWSGIRALRAAASAAFDYEFAAPVIQGLIGWHTDALNRAAALEPHMPAEWRGMTINGLAVGRDRIDATITRERGLMTVVLRRTTTGPPVSIRVSPALPLGADLERIVIDDMDADLNAEESAHDVHAVADLVLRNDAQIEFHYRGGAELVGSTHEDLEIIDFRREAGTYIVTVEGEAGKEYVFRMRSEKRIRAAIGAQAVEQAGENATIRVLIPDGAGAMRKKIRIRM